MSSPEERSDVIAFPERDRVQQDRARARWIPRTAKRKEQAELEELDAAEARAERRVAELLADFRVERPSVPAHMVDEILAHVFTVIEDDAEARRQRIKLFVAAGGVAALAGGAVVGVVAFERHTHVISRLVQVRRGTAVAS